MPRGNLTPDVLGKVLGQPAVNSLKKNYTAGDAVNGHQFTWTGKETCSFRNSGAVGRTFTIQTVADSKLGRVQNITTYNVPAGEEHVLPPLPADGFVQTDGKVYIDVSHAEMLINVQLNPYIVPQS